MEPRFEKIYSSENSSFLFSRFEKTHFPFHWHYHPEFELVLMANCDGKRVVGDHIGEYHETDLVLIGPNLPHSFDTVPQPENRTSPHSATVLHFEEQFLGSGFLEKSEFKNIQQLLKIASNGILFSDEIKKKVIPLLLCLDNITGLPQLFKFIKILDILGQAENQPLLSSEGYVPFEVGSHSTIDKVFLFIQNNFTDDIRLSDVADHCYMSIPHFCSFFKKTTRVTFNHYLNSVRIATACKLLIETNKSVSEVCFESGYNSLSNFNRRFLLNKNFTPKAYRNRFRKK